MDYKRIYDEFIADRLANPPSLGEYAEEHHIQPRCMGGSDEPENLIYLRSEDHFFAHLLLAKAYRTRELWASCFLMIGVYRGNGRVGELLRARRMYGIVRTHYGEANVGEATPGADLSEYTFYHYDGRTFTGTRIAFGAHTGIPASNTNQMIAGKARETAGWSLQPEDPEERRARHFAWRSANAKALKGYVRDWTLYHFYNEDLGLSVMATQTGMRNLDYLNNKEIAALVNDGSFVRDGWCLAENAEWAYDRSVRKGEYSPNFRTETHEFCNSLTGASEVATISEMGLKYNEGDSRPFGDLADGRRRGWKGWHLAGADASNLKILNLKRRFVHPVHGEVECSQIELARRFDIALMGVSFMVRGVHTHAKGWQLVPEDGTPVAPRRNFPLPIEFHNALTGEKVTATVIEMGKRYNNGRTSPFSVLASGTNKFWKGWHLASTDPAEMTAQNRTFRFVHPVHGEEECTQAALGKKYGFHFNKVSELVLGKRIQANGWRLAPPPGETLPELPAYKKHVFCNALTNERVEATVGEMGQRYHAGNNDPFTGLVAEKRPSWRGWYLEGKDPAAVRVFHQKIRVFHPEHGEIECTRRELADRAGCTMANIQALVQGRVKRAKGWSLVTNDPPIPAPAAPINSEQLSLTF